MPAIETGKKVIAFGDFGYYWIADRQGRSFKRLNELYAATGQVGYIASQRVDGKLGRVRPAKVRTVKAVNLNFTVGTIEKRFQDPYLQAQYAYEQIQEKIL